MRLMAFLYGVACYGLTLAVFALAIAFIGDFTPALSIDRGATIPPAQALAVDLGLLALFALQHSVMARPAFKRLFARVVPASLGRSSYVLFSNAALVLLLAGWQPIPSVLWETGGVLGTALRVLQCSGWGVLIASTFMISHTDLFGLKQVHAVLEARPVEPPRFRVVAFYRVVRHPIMLGFLIAFWAAPRMTAGHLVFALAMTAYILAALRLEEADLVRELGDTYRDYQRRVPMLVPGIKAWRR